MTLYPVRELADVYADAFVTDDEGYLLFLSVWGHDTALQELLAKLTLSDAMDGLGVLTLNHKLVFIPEDKGNLAKLTGRTRKDCLFYGLSQLWVYDKLANQFDKANQRALLLKQPADDANFTKYLWHVVRQLCTVPLLPEWDCLLDHFTERQWIRHFKGVNIEAVKVDIGHEEVGTFITQLIQQRVLTLPRPKSHLALAYHNTLKH